MRTSVSPDNGVVNLASLHPVDETTRRLVRVLEHAGMTIFARIDQQGAARAAGVTMQPMTLVVFGSPTAGTPLMQAYPGLALDLPLKALVWEDVEGRVWVSTNSPDYLRRRHSMAEAPFAGVPGLLARALARGPRRGRSGPRRGDPPRRPSDAHPRISSTSPESSSTAKTTRRKRSRSSREKSSMPIARPTTAGSA